MVYKDRNKNIVKVSSDSKFVLDELTQTVTIISVEGMITIPILTYGMNNEEGVFCILDYYNYD